MSVYNCMRGRELGTHTHTEFYLWQGSAGWRRWWRGSQGRRRGRRGWDWHVEASDTCRNKHSCHPITRALQQLISFLKFFSQHVGRCYCAEGHFQWPPTLFPEQEELSPSYSAKQETASVPSSLEKSDTSHPTKPSTPVLLFFPQCSLTETWERNNGACCVKSNGPLPFSCSVTRGLHCSRSKKTRGGNSAGKCNSMHTHCSFCPGHSGHVYRMPCGSVIRSNWSCNESDKNQQPDSKFPGTTHIQDYVVALLASQIVNWSTVTLRPPPKLCDIINSLWDCERVKTVWDLCTFSSLWNLHMLLQRNVINHRTEPVSVQSVLLVPICLCTCVSECVHFVLPVNATGRLSCVSISISISVSSSICDTACGGL